MPSRLKETSKTACSSKKNRANRKQPKFVLLRDQSTEKLTVVPIEEIISAKNHAKLSSGDAVSHGTRGKRIRATITLIGTFSTHV